MRTTHHHELPKLKLGVIGMGQMGTALVDGLLHVGVPHSDIGAFDLGDIHEKAEKRGIIPFSEVKDMAEWADVIFVVVKPAYVKSALDPILEIVREKPVICCAAGVDFDQVEEIMGSDSHHLTVMPCIPVSVGKGTVLMETKHTLTRVQYRNVKEILDALGAAVEVPKAAFEGASTVTGCGPAFVAMYIEAMADAAVLCGVPRLLAYQLVSQTVAGTAELQLATKVHPGVMKDMVCSPAGTTIRGVRTLERSGFRAAVLNAISAITGD